MDKRFFSTDNVKLLLDGDGGRLRCRFLIGFPFICDLAKDLVDGERADIDRIENVELTNSSPTRNKLNLCDWGYGTDLSTHVFYNPETAVKDRNELFGYVMSLAREASVNHHNKKPLDEYAHYLDVDLPLSQDGSVNVGIREMVVSKELATTGWFVLHSSHITEPQAAHDVYRMKNVVEKSFLRYKNNLGLDRLRVHGDDRMQNKIFVAFIALVITSAIHGTMKQKNLYKRMTFSKLILDSTARTQSSASP